MLWCEGRDLRSTCWGEDTAKTHKRHWTDRIRRTEFIERVIGVVWDYSGLMLAARMTLAHFSVSSAMSLPNSAGEPASGGPPRSKSRALILGSAKAVLISRLSLSMTSCDVPLGAAMPHQLIAS